MLIAGIDEAGRGPCMGPLCISVVLIKKTQEEKLISLGLKDSKLLTESQRENFYPQIQSVAQAYSFIKIHPKELDELMTWKSLNEIEAMKIGQLLNELKEKPSTIFVDSPDPIAEEFANRIKKYISFSTHIIAEHKADFNYPIVSAASIIAKVERDKEIKKIAEKFGDIGSGYSSDPKTISFIEKYLEENNKLPEFVRNNWETNKRILDNKFQQKLF